MAVSSGILVEILLMVFLSAEEIEQGRELDCKRSAGLFLLGGPDFAYLGQLIVAGIIYPRPILYPGVLALSVH